MILHLTSNYIKNCPPMQKSMPVDLIIGSVMTNVSRNNIFYATICLFADEMTIYMTMKNGMDSKPLQKKDLLQLEINWMIEFHLPK